jgi:pyrroline-5-carboxylate reductase
MTEPLLPGPIWLVGCGNMAGAMLAGWLARGADARQVTVIRPSGRPAGEGVRVLTALPEDEVPAMVLLGVKPQKLDEVAPGLAPALDPETILVSILAGVELASLRRRFPTPHSIVRAMPNLPVRLNKGVTALFGGEGEARAKVERLMAALGLVEWFDDENLFQIVTVLGGSSPAYLYRFIDALAEAGAGQGLPADQARRIALATIVGAAELAAESGKDGEAMVREVASPGGTTWAGLDILDARLPELVRATLDASVRRGREMAEAARRAPD